MCDDDDDVSRERFVVDIDGGRFRVFRDWDCDGVDGSSIRV